MRATTGQFSANVLKKILLLINLRLIAFYQLPAELSKTKLKELKIRHGLGDINHETYNLTFNHLSDQIRNVTKEINTLSPTISNLGKMLSSALKKFTKLSQVWAFSNLDTKRRIQKTLFPDGILYDVKNHEYLTNRTNSFLYLTDYLSNTFKDEGIKKSRQIGGMSSWAPPSGLEPETL